MHGISLGLSPWRRDALRTTLWVVPMALLIGAAALFLVTYRIDYHVYANAVPYRPGCGSRARTGRASCSAHSPLE